ncbi:hypothetical protein ACIA8R_18335 [Nonomuraea sp. NPDC051191]|uniref:hypothetical protein n=1 Tax=Nonomuraea sp. NPDC051191 TaxID=3364372 RepID=UPI00378E475D
MRAAVTSSSSTTFRPTRTAVTAAAGLTILERTVNGRPGLVAQQDGVTVAVMAFKVANDRISHCWAVRNPDKLRAWTAGCPPVRGRTSPRPA